MDRTDRQIVAALQDDARLTSGELAQIAHLSQSPCWRRVKRLEDGGVIAGYHAALDRRALGLGVMVFVMVGIDHQ
ncbi:Lrp/AsnC family transcriptional regulator, partial [Streptomyces javensis]|nr:Lrp/AsnC family transcriptional regulator [Streptomyces javensis]